MRNTKFPQDRIRHRICVLECIDVGESQHPNSQFRECLGSPLVVGPALMGRVLAAIKFNSDGVLLAIEIEYVSGDRMLAAELQAREALIAENGPKLLFRVGWFPAHAAGEREESTVIISTFLHVANRSYNWPTTPVVADQALTPTLSRRRGSKSPLSFGRRLG